MATRKLEVVFVGDTRQLDSSLNKVGAGASQTQGKLAKVGAALRKGLAAGGIAAAAGLGKSISAATDLNEQVNKAATVFRGSEKGIMAWSKTTATSLGISQRAALEAAGTFGNMLVPMGFARSKAADMSKGLVNLSADLASFNNASPEDTLEALRAGLAGETEPLRKFGIFLNDARLKQEALSLGIYKGKGPLDAQAKAQATYSLILKDSKDAQGDFAKTSDSLANRQRILKAQAENLAASLGTFLIPVVQKVAGWASKLAEKWDGLSQGQKKLVATIGSVLAVLGPVALIAPKVAAGVSTLARGFGALVKGGQLLFAFLRAAPVLLGPVGIAILGLSVAALLVWKNWDKVKDALGAAWDWLKGAAEDAFGAIRWAAEHGFLGPVPAIIANWGKLKGAISDVLGAVVGAMRSAANAVASAARTIAHAFLDTVRSFASPFVDVGKWVVNRLVDGVKTMAHALVDAAGWLKNRVVDGVKAYVSGYLEVGGWIVNRLVDGVTAVGSFAGRVGGWLKNRVVEGLHAFSDDVGAVGGWVTNRIVAGATGIAGVAKEVGSWVRERVEGAWDYIKGAAHGLGEKIGGGITSAIKGALGGGKALVNAIVDMLNAAIPNKISIPHAPDINLPDNPIPHLASGGVAPGGWVRVGELGPEWAQLPAGTRVHSASESRRMDQGGSGGPGGGPLIGQVIVQGSTDPRVIARDLAWALATR